MACAGCVNIQIEWEEFSGGFFYNCNLPYSKEEYYTISEDQGILVLLSGQIYNHNEIISQLNIDEQEIPHPKLILAAFVHWGETFVFRLNGDFSIFLYQRDSHQFFLYRDHMGAKPLAYSILDGTFWFSSDKYGLSKTLYKKEGIDKKFILNRCIYFGLPSSRVESEFTLLPNSNVLNVFPGHYIHVTDSEVNIKKYWAPELLIVDNKLSFLTAKKELAELVLDAVRIRCDERFTASGHVSGGLDSGIISSLVRREYFKQSVFMGFCWTSANQIIDEDEDKVEFDERKLVKEVCLNAAITPLFVNVDKQEVIEYLSDWRHTTDFFYEKKVRELAIQNNVNLIFSGWGGDDFFSIDSKGVDSDFIFNFQLLPFFKKNPITNPKKIISTLLFNVFLPALTLRFFTRKKTWQDFSKYLLIDNKEKLKTLNDFYSWRSRKQVHLRMLNDYHITERLEDWAINGFRKGIEYRYPLIDKRIIEYMFKVPSKILCQDGFDRFIAREIGQGIIPDVVRWHVSKNDPIRINQLYKLYDSITVQLMDELEVFRANPVFNFIRFDLLKEDFLKFKKGELKGRPGQLFEILFFLKNMNEFIKAYCN